MRGVLCVACGRGFELLERIVPVRVERPLTSFWPPVVAGLPMHADCAREHERERDSDYYVAERSPTGYPLRFVKRANV